MYFLWVESIQNKQLATRVNEKQKSTLEFEQQSTQSLINRIYNPLYNWLSDSITISAETDIVLVSSIGTMAPEKDLELSPLDSSLRFDIL